MLRLPTSVMHIHSILVCTYHFNTNMYFVKIMTHMILPPSPANNAMKWSFTSVIHNNMIIDLESHRGWVNITTPSRCSLMAMWKLRLMGCNWCYSYIWLLSVSRLLTLHFTLDPCHSIGSGSNCIFIQTGHSQLSSHWWPELTFILNI